MAASRAAIARSHPEHLGPHDGRVQDPRPVTRKASVNVVKPRPEDELPLRLIPGGKVSYVGRCHAVPDTGLAAGVRTW